MPDHIRQLMLISKHKSGTWRHLLRSLPCAPSETDVNVASMCLLSFIISCIILSFLFVCFPGSSSRHPSVSWEPSQRTRSHRQPALSRRGDSQPPAGLAEERHGHREQAVQTAHPPGYESRVPDCLLLVFYCVRLVSRPKWRNTNDKNSFWRLQFKFKGNSCTSWTAGVTLTFISLVLCCWLTGWSKLLWVIMMQPLHSVFLATFLCNKHFFCLFFPYIFAVLLWINPVKFDCRSAFSTYKIHCLYSHILVGGTYFCLYANYTSSCVFPKARQRVQPPSW